jgi:hypothetical protein
LWPVRSRVHGGYRGTRTQIEWRNYEVRRFALPTAGPACKHQLRGTGCRAGLRSDLNYEGWVRYSPTQNIYSSHRLSAGTVVRPQGFAFAGQPRRLSPLGSGQLRSGSSPLDDATKPLSSLSCAFSLSGLQKSRPIREHTRFAHPYRSLLRKRPKIWRHGISLQRRHRRPPT